MLVFVNRKELVLGEKFFGVKYRFKKFNLVMVLFLIENGKVCVCIIVFNFGDLFIINCIVGMN